MLWLYALLVDWQDRLLRLRTCWRGHTMVLIVEPPELYLECTACHHRSHGWFNKPVPVRGPR